MQKYAHLRPALWLASLLFTLFALPNAAAAQETQDTMKLTAQLRTARAALSQAYTKLDGAAAASHYADNIIVEFGPESFSGKQAATAWITQTLQGVSALNVSAPSFKVTDTEVIERSAYTVVMSDGQSQPGTVETAWKKQADGAWKVARMTVM